MTGCKQLCCTFGRLFLINQQLYILYKCHVAFKVNMLPHNCLLGAEIVNRCSRLINISLLLANITINAAASFFFFFLLVIHV